jgi:CRP-like cAMP-binding protein
MPGVDSLSNDKTKFYQAGNVIFEEGDASHHAYMIKEGAVELSTVVQGRKKILYTMRKGQVFGEMGIISDSPRSATATCVEDSSFSIIDRAAIEAKMNGADPYLKYLIDFLIERVKTLSKENTA